MFKSPQTHTMLPKRCGMSVCHLQSRSYLRALYVILLNWAGIKVKSQPIWKANTSQVVTTQYKYFSYNIEWASTSSGGTIISAGEKSDSPSLELAQLTTLTLQGQTLSCANLTFMMAWENYTDILLQVFQACLTRLLRDLTLIYVVLRLMFCSWKFLSLPTLLRGNDRAMVFGIAASGTRFLQSSKYFTNHSNTRCRLRLRFGPPWTSPCFYWMDKLQQQPSRFFKPRREWIRSSSFGVHVEFPKFYLFSR